MVVASLIATVLYIWDKHRAQKNKSRITERTLLFWSALGGWPGAIVTGRIVRHKTQKLSYRIKFAFCITFNVCLILLVAYIREKM